MKAVLDRHEAGALAEDDAGVARAFGTFEFHGSTLLDTLFSVHYRLCARSRMPSRRKLLVQMQLHQLFSTHKRHHRPVTRGHISGQDVLDTIANWAWPCAKVPRRPDGPPLEKAVKTGHL